VLVELVELVTQTALMEAAQVLVLLRLATVGLLDLVVAQVQQVPLEEMVVLEQHLAELFLLEVAVQPELKLFHKVDLVEVLISEVVEEVLGEEVLVLAVGRMVLLMVVEVQVQGLQLLQLTLAALAQTEL
jgi:hypothetical protein